MLQWLDGEEEEGVWMVMVKMKRTVERRLGEKS